MSFCCTRRWLHATLTACAVIVGVLAGTAQFASASNVPCPSGGNRAGSISEWETTWPPSRTDGMGVTMCLGEEGIWGTDKGWLQIVDLGARAKIRLISESESAGPTPEFLEPDVLYRKRTAPDWYSWIRTLEPEEEPEGWAYANPDPELLFSTTNASFMITTNSISTNTSGTSAE